MGTTNCSPAYRFGRVVTLTSDTYYQIAAIIIRLLQLCLIVTSLDMNISSYS